MNPFGSIVNLIQIWVVSYFDGPVPQQEAWCPYDPKGPPGVWHLYNGWLRGGYLSEFWCYVCNDVNSRSVRQPRGMRPGLSIAVGQAGMYILSDHTFLLHRSMTKYGTKTRMHRWVNR